MYGLFTDMMPRAHQPLTVTMLLLSSQWCYIMVMHSSHLCWRTLTHLATHVASHTDILRLVTGGKPKNVCLGGYHSCDMGIDLYMETLELVLRCRWWQHTHCCSYCVIVRVSVVLKGTVVGDWRFDNLSGSHLQSQVNSVCQSLML